MSDALTPIIAAKRQHLIERKRRWSFADRENLAMSAPSARGFADALKKTSQGGGLALIAEMKRKSPSGGYIRPDFDPASVARDYRAGGATCLSILTDEPYFGGKDEDIAHARAAVQLPALRKDFVIDPYQIVESRALGADCILLIVSALSDQTLGEFAAEAKYYGMDCLVEVHDEAELDRALALDSVLLGINNRNLKTLTTDLATFERLAPRVPAERLLIAESGLRTKADLDRMAASGARGFLVGESLLRQEDLAGATRALLTGQ